jgi:hypothetical protein
VLRPTGLDLDLPEASTWTTVDMIPKDQSLSISFQSPFITSTAASLLQPASLPIPSLSKLHLSQLSRHLFISYRLTSFILVPSQCYVVGTTMGQLRLQCWRGEGTYTHLLCLHFDSNSRAASGSSSA